MHGNVYEWYSDWYGEYVTTAVDDPSGAPAGSDRVLVRELLARVPAKPSGRAADRKVEDFLAAKAAPKADVLETTAEGTGDAAKTSLTSPAPRQTGSQGTLQGTKAEKAKHGKPVFQQS
jgi:hypothetical protein